MMMMNHFDHIYKQEAVMLSTMIKNTNYIDEFDIYSNIFANEIYRDIFIALTNLYEEKIVINSSSLFERASKINSYITLEEIEEIINLEEIPLINIKGTLSMIKQNKVRISIFNLTLDYHNKSIDNSIKVDDLFINLESELEQLKTAFDVKGESLDDVIDIILSRIDDIHDGKISNFLKSGSKEIDSKLAISANSIMLVAGPEKQGKTKFVSWLIRGIHENNENIACQWFSMEDDKFAFSDMLTSPYCLLRADEINGKKRLITGEERDKLIAAIKYTRRFNIDIHDTPVNIQTIHHKFSIFAKKNKGKTPICVIDNAKLLTDKDDGKRDTHIMNTISIMRQKTGGLIILIHHFNEAQKQTDKLKTGYRPTGINISGQADYRRVPNQVLLINKPSKYKDLMNQYELERDILEYMFIVDIEANRGIKEEETDSSSENNLIYMYATLDYNIFKPLSEIYLND